LVDTAGFGGVRRQAGRMGAPVDAVFS